MLANQGQAAAQVSMLNASAANTAAATSEWIDVRRYEGGILLTQCVGAITGSVTGGIEDATDISGTGGAAFTPADGVFTAVSSANDVQKRVIKGHSTRGFIRYVGTIVTGPAVVSVLLMAHPKYV